MISKCPVAASTKRLLDRGDEKNAKATRITRRSLWHLTAPLHWSQVPSCAHFTISLCCYFASRKSRPNSVVSHASAYPLVMLSCGSPKTGFQTNQNSANRAPGVCKTRPACPQQISCSSVYVPPPLRPMPTQHEAASGKEKTDYIKIPNCRELHGSVKSDFETDEQQVATASSSWVRWTDRRHIRSSMVMEATPAIG